MERDRAGADRGGRLEHGQAVAAGGVHDVLAGVDRAAGREHGDDVGQHVVGDGQQQQVAGAGDRGGLLGRDAGQQRGDPAARGVGLTGGGDDLVAGAAEGGGEDGSDPAGADDADPQRPRARGAGTVELLMRRTSRCSPSAIRGGCRGPVRVPDDCCSVTLIRQRRGYAARFPLGTGTGVAWITLLTAPGRP